MFWTNIDFKGPQPLLSEKNMWSRRCSQGCWCEAVAIGRPCNRNDTWPAIWTVWCDCHRKIPQWNHALGSISSAGNWGTFFQEGAYSGQWASWICTRATKDRDRTWAIMGPWALQIRLKSWRQRPVQAGSIIAVPRTVSSARRRIAGACEVSVTSQPVRSVCRNLRSPVFVHVSIVIHSIIIP